MKTLYLLILLGISSLWMSCNRSGNGREIIAYINDPRNGIFQEKERTGLQVQVQYIPTDLQVLSEYAGRPGREALDSSRKQYDSYAYFKLVLTDAQVKPRETDAAHLDFGLTDDFYLQLNNGNVIPCTFYQRIPTGDKHRYEFMVVFEKETDGGGPVHQDFRFVYADKVFGMDTIAFNFRHKDLQNIPQL